MTDFPVQVLSADAEIEAELVEGSGIDWLELHLGVMVDGERVDLVPALVRLIARPEAAALAEGADDKPFVLTAAGWADAVAADVAHPPDLAGAAGTVGERRDRCRYAERIGFSRLDAADLAGLEERTGLVWRGGEALRELGRTLRQAGRNPEGGGAGVVPGDVAAVSGAGCGLAAVPGVGRAGRRAGRRHGPGQDGADAGAPDDREG